MKDLLKSVSSRLQSFNLALCVLLLCILFCAQITMVLMRYMMGIGFLEIQDLVTYSFACLVTLTVPLALAADRHVRVDIFRSKFGSTTNQHIDLLGHVFLTLPVFALLLINGYPLVRDSWALLEGSRETGGLPGLFVVRSTVIAMAMLILIQAAAQIAIQSTRESKP